jgi:hypothetical protein
MASETEPLVEAGETVTAAAPLDAFQVPSPLYCALMVSVPTASVVTVSVPSPMSVVRCPAAPAERICSPVAG